MNPPNRNRKLTPAQVQAVKSSPMISTVLAKHYGVSPKTIRDIRDGKSYLFIKGNDK